MSDEKKHILIVDDEPNNLQLMRQVLEDQYKLAFATSGQKALKIVYEINPDLILLDIVMPDVNGYEICKNLKSDEHTRDIPIIFITAMGDEIDEAKGLEMGAVDYIIKPISRHIVRARVKNHLELKQARKDLEKQNRFIKKIFGRYLSDDIVKNILETPEGMKIGGERRKVTVLITDLRGFTSMCEQYTPEEVVGTINIFLEKMIKITLRYGGTIEEIVGDGLVIVFNAPVLQEDHPLLAVRCALEMQLAMPEINQRNLEIGYPRVDMGIGVNTGDVVVGNIGSDMRTKYGIIGKNVNLAARIESYTVGGQILISENTKNACGSILQINNRQEVIAKGVSAPINIYEISGIGGEHNIYLPEKKDIKMIPAIPPLDAIFRVVEDKHASRTAYNGKVFMIGSDCMEVKCERSFRPFTDLKIVLFDPDGMEIAGDFYGKLFHIDNSNDFRIQFTSVSPMVRKFIDGVLNN